MAKNHSKYNHLASDHGDGRQVSDQETKLIVNPSSCLRACVNVMFCVAVFRPGGRATFVSAKVAKTNDAPPASLD